MSIYVTYLTTYRGSRMPMFYVGSTSLKRIENGYNGTVCSREYKTIWNYERKHNPHLFTTRILTQHKTRQDALARERAFHLSLSVLHNPLYINKCIAGFHGTSFAGKNNPRYGVEFSKDTRHKMSIAKIGKRQSPDHIEKRASQLRGTPKDPTNIKFNFNQTYTCPHCGKVGRGPAMLGHIRKKLCAR